MRLETAVNHETKVRLLFILFKKLFLKYETYHFAPKNTGKFIFIRNYDMCVGLTFFLLRLFV